LRGSELVDSHEIDAYVYLTRSSIDFKQKSTEIKAVWQHFSRLVAAFSLRMRRNGYL